MIRQAAAVVVVLLLSPSWVSAQGTELTVNVASASVYKSPTNVSPVLGVVGHGARLEVTREVGDWVKIAYPPAADGVGYVRKSMGSVAPAATSKAAISSTGTASRTTSPPTQAAPRVVSTSGEQAQTGNRLPVRNTGPQRSTTSHMFGLGARLGGPAFGIGASGRAWALGRLGLQAEVAHYNVSSPIDLGTMSSTEFGTSALYAFNERVADY